MPEPRLVLDSNVYVSGLLWTGLPHRLLRVAEAGEIILVTTPSILEEVRNALGRERFAARLAALTTSPAELLGALVNILTVVKEPPVEPVIAQDPDDDKVLACAKASQAQWIVTGDSHLLAMKRYHEIPIVTPRQFWQIWTRRAK